MKPIWIYCENWFNRLP